MIPKSLEAIKEPDLQDLVTNKVAEGKTLEYKQALPGDRDADKKDFLAEMSSFANTIGGDLLLGVTAVDGIPTAISGITGANKDKETLRIEQICRNGLQPRLAQMALQWIDLASGASVLVIRVRKSWSALHRVVFAGHGHFYARHSNGVYQMDVGEIRAGFLQAEAIPERIRSFRLDRLARIAADDTPVPFIKGPRLVMHMVPLTAFSGPSPSISLQPHERHDFAPPDYRGSHTNSVNFDGYILHTAGAANGECSDYVQIYRNGIVEFVETQTYAASHTSGPTLFPRTYEPILVRFGEQVERVLKLRGVERPYYCLLSFLGVRESQFAVGGGLYPRHPQQRPDRDDLILPEVLVEEGGGELATALKPAFDRVWNAFGYEGSFNYRSDGKFDPPKR